MRFVAIIFIQLLIFDLFYTFSITNRIQLLFYLIRRFFLDK